MTKGASATPTNFFDPDKMEHANWMGWYSAHPWAEGWHKPVGSGEPAGTGATTTLKVTFNSEEAGYANSMGWYNARTGQAGILFQDLNDDGSRAGVHAGDARTLTVLQSDVDAGNVGFFLIPNGANELSKSLLSSQMRFEVGSNGDGRIVIDRDYGHDVVLNGTHGDVLFSDQTYNRGDFDYVSGKVGTDGETRAQKFGTQSDGPDGILGTMAWDDQAVQQCNQGTDRDFNDVVFTVSKEGSSNPPPPPPPPPNSAPTDISLSNASINENVAGGVIGTLSTVDPNAGDTHSYTVSDSRFEVVNGQLKLKAGTSLDFESQSSVQLKVTTTDQGGLGFSENFTITVKDVNEAPTDIGLSNLTVDENASGAVIGNLSTTDPDAGNTHSYAVSDNRFEVVNGQLKLKAGTSLDFETQSSVQLKVTTTDQGGLSFSENFTIAVKDVNEAPANSAPTDIALSNASINENVLGGVIGTLSTVDPNAGDTHIYTVSDNRFEVVSGQLKLKSGIGLDHEAEGSVQLKVTTTDQGGLSFSENFTVTVKDVAEAPVDIVLDGSAVDESESDIFIGTLSTIDPDSGDAHHYTIDDERFQIIGDQLWLREEFTLDHETEPTIIVNVTSIDLIGNSITKALTIEVRDLNEAPSAPVDDDPAENFVLKTAAIGTAVGITGLSTDPDAGDSVTYSLSDNAGGLFAVDPTTGLVTVAGALDNDMASAHMITLRATDKSGQFGETDLLIQVGDAASQSALLASGGSDFDQSIAGDGGNNLIQGGAGNDQIFGNAGDDVLDGGAGNDVLNGGVGKDTFVFDLSQAGADTLVGFDRADDTLSFTHLTDTGSNGIDLNDLLAIVSGVHDFGQGGNVVVDFTTGASLTFQGAGTAGGTIQSLTSLVASPSTQIQVA
jgi:Ca2+-binding RTX toxin-like protein